MAKWDDPVYVRNYMRAYLREYSKQSKWKEYQKQYRNTEKYKAYFRTEEYRAKKNARARAVRKNTPTTEKRKESIRRYEKWYRQRPDVRLKAALRARIASALKGYKGFHMQELIGCSSGFLMNHLEEQFQSGMTWENHSKKGWHIDHIIPFVWFGNLLKAPEWQKVSCHWTNLRPVWAEQNLSKGGKERFTAKEAKT